MPVLRMETEVVDHAGQQLIVTAELVADRADRCRQIVHTLEWDGGASGQFRDDLLAV